MDGAPISRRRETEDAAVAVRQIRAVAAAPASAPTPPRGTPA
jgi:hypothetical protein